jgi:hypothetical protein
MWLPSRYADVPAVALAEANINPSTRRTKNKRLVPLLLKLHPTSPQITTINANGRIRLHRFNWVHYRLGQTLQFVNGAMEVQIQVLLT